MYSAIIAPRRGKPNKDGSTSLVLRITIHGIGREDYGLKIKLSPATAWDKELGEPTGAAFKRKLVLAAMDKHFKKAEKILDSLFLEDRLNFDEFNQILKPKKYKNFYQFIEKELSLISDDGTKDETITTYKTIIVNLQEFSRERIRESGLVYFSDLTPEFARRFRGFLRTHNKYMESTISKKMSILRIFTKAAFDNNLIPKRPFSSIKVKRAKIKDNYIPEPHIEKLLSERQFNDRLERARLYLLFGICAAPLRFSDMVNLKWDDIAAGRLRIQQKKPGTSMEVPISKIGFQILERIKSLWHDQDNGKSSYVFPPISSQKLNPALKELANNLNIIPRDITSHIVRHTFKTMATEKGVDFEAREIFLGHSEGKRYGKVTYKALVNEIEKYTFPDLE